MTGRSIFHIEGAEHLRGSMITAVPVSRPQRCRKCGRMHIRFLMVCVQMPELSVPYYEIICRSCFDELSEASNGMLQVNHEILARFLMFRRNLSDALYSKLKLKNNHAERPIVPVENIN